MTEWLMIAGMAAATFGVRYSVLAVLSRSKLPTVVLQALQFVPVAVLSAIVVPMLLAPAGVLELNVRNHALVAGVLAIAVAAASRNLLLTIALGMVGFFALRVLG